jgi:hypothetical protein
MRVAVLRFDSLPAGSKEARSLDTERRRLRDLATTLKRADLDFIVLSEVKSRQACNALVNFLRPRDYHIAICSNFRSPDASSAAQVAILARSAPLAAWAEDWRGPPRVDAPGGFAFAAFRSGTNAVGFFALQFGDPAATRHPTAPSASISYAHQAAARYVTHHVKWVEGRVTNGVAGFLVAGDWSAVRLFEHSGFRDGLRPAADRQKVQSEGLLLRKTSLTGLEVQANPDGGYWLLKGKLEVETSDRQGGQRSPFFISEILAQAQAHFLAFKDKLSWAAGIMIGSVFVAAGVWRLRRCRRSGALPVPVAPQSAFVVEVGPTAGKRSFAVGQVTTATGSLRSGEGESQIALWQRRALAAEERAREAALHARAGLMPLFAHVLKQRLFTWFTAQRRYLITSHEIGTQQIVELEQRLTQLQSQFQERVLSSQQRIAELEQDIAAKERTIRDLLRAQVRLADQPDPD